jgi:methyl-accepting chemotaxis protein
MTVRPLTLFRHSVVARLLVPVGLMACLVGLIGLVTLTTHNRLHEATAAVERQQAVRVELIEARSLSRSIQRDVLNLVIENDDAERRTIAGKLSTRTRQFASVLDRLVGGDALAGQVGRGAYLDSQRIVLRRLKATAAFLQRGDRAAGLNAFRHDVRPAERQASALADALIAKQEAMLAMLDDHNRVLQGSASLVVGSASLVLFLIAAIGTLMIVRRTVTGPLADIGAAMARVADGHTDHPTPHGDRVDEIGRMARAIEHFRHVTRSHERRAVAETAAHTAAIQRQLADEQVQRHIAEAEAARQRALARAARALEHEAAAALDGLRDAARQLSEAATALAGHSAAASQELEDVNAAVGRAAIGATEIAAATDQFMTAIDGASAATRGSAALGTEAAAQAVVLARQMTQVQDDASTVVAVVDLIGGIARQTNLLALNASIEASRVDKAGTGFAVVATEVKALAGETARATDRISAQATDMQHAGREAGRSLTRISETIRTLSDGAATLAMTMAEQADSGRTISRNVAGTAADLDLIRARADDMASAAAGVDALARKVRSDAALVEGKAGVIDRALGQFFARLHERDQTEVMAR